MVVGVSRDRNRGGSWLMRAAYGTETVGREAPGSLFTFHTWPLVTWPTLVIWTCE